MFFSGQLLYIFGRSNLFLCFTYIDCLKQYFVIEVVMTQDNQVSLGTNSVSIETIVTLVTIIFFVAMSVSAGQNSSPVQTTIRRLEQDPDDQFSDSEDNTLDFEVDWETHRAD